MVFLVDMNCSLDQYLPRLSLGDTLTNGIFLANAILKDACANPMID